jgi:hypothetical protein
LANGVQATEAVVSGTYPDLGAVTCIADAASRWSWRNPAEALLLDEPIGTGFLPRHARTGPEPVPAPRPARPGRWVHHLLDRGVHRVGTGTLSRGAAHDGFVPAPCGFDPVRKLAADVEHAAERAEFARRYAGFGRT